MTTARYAPELLPFAELGNTGRTTGPHLRYEVRVNGIAQNPRKFFLPDYEMPSNNPQPQPKRMTIARYAPELLPFAELGNTGRTTGPHLRYEVRVNGIAQNPRKFFLPDY